jgi:hypothetical protein
MLAYSSYTGFTPKTTAEDIPSGTLAMAPGTPATASCRSVPGSDAGPQPSRTESTRGLARDSRRQNVRPDEERRS